MNKVVEELSKIGIVPVIALDDAKDAEPLAKALIEGGLPCAEVTFRTAAAEESIRIMAEKFPELVVGAGTVLTPEQADRAMNAGAKFIVSPGLNPKVVKHCLDKGYPIVPGTSNPSDVETAIELGLDVVKFFPAEAAGGLNMIKSMAAPYTNMKFMPTGGINAGNLKSYLDFGKIVCCGGSWMVKKDMVAAGDFEGIKNLTREAVDTMLGFEVRHVGVNLQSGEEAEDLADTFNKMFSFEKKVGNSSVFSGTGFELMKKQGRGTHGHIAIATNYIERAIYHLEKRGFGLAGKRLKNDQYYNSPLIIGKGGWKKNSSKYRVRERQTEIEKVQNQQIHLLTDLLDGTCYEMEQASVGLFPLVMQVMHNNMTDGISKINFYKRRTKELQQTLILCFQEGEESIELEMGWNQYIENKLSIHGETYLVAVKGELSSDVDDNPVLKVEIVYLEEAMRRKLYVTFVKDTSASKLITPEYIEIKWYESPGKALIMEGMESITTEVTKHPIYSRIRENGGIDLLHRLMEQTIEPVIKGRIIDSSEEAQQDTEVQHPEISGD